MRCLYEVLAVEMNADDGTIKTAYRRAALQWHPDKNQDRPEEAAERFKEIQNAYEVLSDRHERAWYDSHRAAILRSGSAYQAGAEGFAAGEAPDSEVDLFPFFSASCYSGYGEGPQSFYAVYGDVFARLAANERDARARADAPAFGSAATAWAEVAAFYAHWTAFSTAKDFAWADQYNPASAPNRKVRRLMEEDNRKRRAKVKREFNETVRELAAFVRKRDKRVAAHQAEQAARKLQQEAAARERREAERKEREARARAFREAEWVTAAADDATSSDSDGVTEMELLQCVACNKLFRSAGALANHERSKKHLEAVATLRAMLERDEELAGDGGRESQGGSSSASRGEDGGQSSDGDGGQSSDGDGGHSSDGDGVAGGDNESSSGTAELATHPGDAPSSGAISASGGSRGGCDSSAARSERSSAVPATSSSSAASSVADDMDDDEFVSRLARGQGKAAFGAAASSSSEEASPSEASDDSDTSMGEGSEDLGGSDECEGAGGSQSAEAAGVTAGAEAIEGAAAEVGAARADIDAVTAGLGSVRLHARKKAAQSPPAASSGGGPSDLSMTGAQQGGKAKAKARRRARGKAPLPAEPELACRACGLAFESRTKLFKHLAQTGHH